MTRRLFPVLLACLALAPPTAAQPAGSAPGPAEAAEVELRPTTGVTAAPSSAEWARAPRVKLARPIPAVCEARLRAEWLRLRCRPEFGLPLSGMVLAGESSDVAFYFASWLKTKNEAIADVVLPLREGRRNLIQLTAGAGELGLEMPFVLLSADWPRGRDRPTVTLSPTVYGGPFRGIEIASKDEAVSVARTANKKLRWHGVYISHVEPGSRADKAGVEPADKFVESMVWSEIGGIEGIHIAFAHADWGPIKLASMRGASASMRPFWLPVAPQYSAPDE